MPTRSVWYRKLKNCSLVVKHGNMKDSAWKCHPLAEMLQWLKDLWKLMIYTKWYFSITSHYISNLQADYPTEPSLCSAELPSAAINFFFINNVCPCWRTHCKRIHLATTSRFNSSWNQFRNETSSIKNTKHWFGVL